MTALRRIGIDASFRNEAASISPANAYSALRSGRDRDRPLPPAEWIARATADGSALKDVLARQLGSRWSGRDAEAPERRAFLGLLALVSIDGAVPMLARLNRAALEGADVVKACERMVEEAAGTVAATVARRAERHGWSGTVACEMVAAAKSGAPVVPASHFLWMADVDRTLWLLMSCHGRNESYAEVAAIRAHHHAETVMGMALEETWFEHLEDELRKAR